LKAVENAMKLKRIALAVVVLLALLIVVPFLIPMGTYVKQVEQVASEKLGQPVSVGSLRLALLPTPRVNVGTLRIGRNDDVTVDNIAVVPELGSLFSEMKVISSVVVKHPAVKRSALDFISTMPKSENKPAKVQIRRLVISDAQLEWEGMKIPALNAEAMLAEGNKLQSASLASVDGKLKVNAIPKEDGYAIKLEAHQWIPPAGPALLFDSLSSDMALKGNRLDISAFDAKLYHGALDATAGLSWGKEWRASGRFKTQGIEVGEVAALFSKSKPVSGKLSGDGTFGANAKDAAALADQLVLDYKFNVANGVLHGVDLAKAATLLLNAGERGGETKFDEMTGILHMVGKQIELKTFKVSSGLLAASGGIKVSPARQLDGKVEVELKKGVALVSVPLQVSGTLDNPSVMPTKAALAGAIAGTGVLGPGIGTSLGVKAATGMEKIKGLFGGSKK
jgi:uncharacterized protein involved in outer membrane biogenesis